MFCFRPPSVWSLGLSLLALVGGKFPYEDVQQVGGYWGLLQVTTLS